MKLWSTILAALFALTLLSACGQKAEEAPVEESVAPAEQAAPAADVEESQQAAPEEAQSTEPGGYEPTPDERIPPAEAEEGS